MENLLSNQWFLGFLGWFTYNMILLMLAKDPYDDEGKSFYFEVYWRKNWDNMFVTALLTFIWVLAGPEIFKAYDQGSVWFDIMYLGSPIFFQKVIEWVKAKNKKTS